MLTFKVTVELIEPEKEVEKMDISDAGLAKSKQESLDKVMGWIDDELFRIKWRAVMERAEKFLMLPYTTDYKFTNPKL